MHYRNGTTGAIARALGLVSGALRRLEGLELTSEWLGWSNEPVAWHSQKVRGCIAHTTNAYYMQPNHPVVHLQNCRDTLQLLSVRSLHARHTAFPSAGGVSGANG